MSARIVSLPKILADQIAAGEVIEGPASVVKELVENAIDAGAGCISIWVRDGGRELIRVRDDGSGMSADDVPRAPCRHATSKIRTFNDIMNLQTHGFRGEALAAIAAVSRLRIESAEAGASHTTILEADPMAAAPAITHGPHVKGTTVSVAHLFSWVPARKKFLGSWRAEQARVVRALWPLMLMHPHVAFEIDLGAAARDAARYGVCASVRERYFQLFPMHRPEEVFQFEHAHTEHPLRVSGFLSNPLQTMATPRHFFLAINHRCVRLPAVLAAMRRLYAAVDGARGMPWGFIHLETPPHWVDFNVDPKKESARLVQERVVSEFIYKAIEGIMRTGRMITPSSVRMGDWQPYGAGEPPSRRTLVSEMDCAPGAPCDATRFEAVPPSPSLIGRATAPPSLPPMSPAMPMDADRGDSVATRAADSLEEAIPWASLRFVGCVQACLLCAYDDDAIYFFDQHAMDERIQYEKYMAVLKQSAIPIQKALIPETLAIDDETQNLIEEARDVLCQMGFEFQTSRVGKLNQLTLTAYPACFDFYPDAAVLVEWLHQEGRPVTETAFSDRMARLIADLVCKRSVKRGESLHPDKAAHLMKEAARWLSDRKTCQHGRPFFVKIPLASVYQGFYR